MIINNRFFSSLIELCTSRQDMVLNINRFNHREIVQGLHALYHDTPKVARGQTFRPIYSDGSESKPFHIEPLPKPQEPDKCQPPLRLGFLSGRHLELDAFVDFYIMRNSEQLRFASSAELESEIYQRVSRLFHDLVLHPTQTIEVYHTGLESVTLGFYRAVIDNSIQRDSPKKTKMIVGPHIWTKRPVRVHKVLASAGSVLQKARTLTELRRLVVELPDFIGLWTDKHEQDIELSWKKERPMWVAEQDYLCRRYPYLRPLVRLLSESNRYQKEYVWGV